MPTKEHQFEELTARYLDRLFQTALCLSSDRACAEQAVRDACALAWKSFDKETEHESWCIRLFQILFQGVRRKNRRWFSRPGGSALEVVVQLPESCREVIVLIDGQGFTYKEAARILDISIESLSESLKRGRDLLLQKFGAPSPAGDTRSFPPALSLEAAPPQRSAQND